MSKLKFKTSVDNSSVNSLPNSISLNVTGDDTFIESNLVELTGGNYEGKIPPDVVVTPGVDLYIYAEDAIGNIATSGSSNNPYQITVRNTAPPENITGFTVAKGTNDGEIIGSWTNTPDGDFVGVKFRYRTDGIFPLNATDGIDLSDETGPSSTSDSTIWSGLDTGVTVYYITGFAYDDAQNYASGTQAPGGLKPRDLTPPDNVINFTAIGEDKQVSLTWINPTDPDFAGVKILRKTDSFPSTPTDGTVVYDSTETSFTDTKVIVNGTTYYYKAFTYDEVASFGSGVQASTTPTPDGGMVQIPAGIFIMGSNSGDSDEQPVHNVSLTEYYIDKHEVTNTKFARFLSAGNDSYYDTKMEIIPSEDIYIAQLNYENHPVVYIDWYGAKAYCEWEGKRLPTEAEWEMAARGTDGRTYPWGDGIDGTRANFWDSGDPYDNETTPAGYYNGFNNGTKDSPSPFGAYDMSGNAWEWVSDWYDSSYYSYSLSINPQGPGSGNYRIVRGGSWVFNSNNLRTAYRYSLDPSGKFSYTGFRCVRDGG